MNVESVPWERAVEWITPEYAAELLSKGAPNRNISPERVNRWLRLMQRGAFKTTPQGIMLDQDGRLMDGQHRLAAIVKYGKPVLMEIARGVPTTYFQALDGGKARNLADDLHILGYKRATDLSSAINAVWGIQRMFGRKRPALNYPDRDEALAFLKREPALPEALSVGAKVYNQIGGPRRIYSATFYILANIDWTDAVDFFDRLGSGESLQEGDPIFALRRSVLRAVRDNMGRLSVEPVWLSAMIILGWNAYRKGATVNVLSWRRGGANPQIFPIPE